MRPLLKAAICACALTASANAQVFGASEVRPPRFLDQWVWGFDLFGGIPLGDFRKHENGGGGAEFMVGVQPWRRQPLLIRSHVATLIYGSVDAQGFQDVCDIFGCRTETVSYTARNHVMTSLHVGPEFFATDGPVRPFGFALLGITFFNSWANLQPTTPGGTSPGSSSLFSSNNFSTAYGAGVRFVKTKYGREFGLELASRVTRNAKARYLTEGGMTLRLDSTWDVTPQQSAAHVLGIHLGFWMGPYINWNERRER